MLAKLGIEVVLLPVIAGISYEVLKLVAKFNGKISLIFKAPGFFIQKVFTTREPDAGMAEVAIAAFERVLAMDADPQMEETEFITGGILSQKLSETKQKFAEKGIDDSDAEWIYSLTLGIKPSRPETGYGYIQVGEKSDVDGILEVKTFTEKPDVEIARIFVESGEFFWNSGIFLWSADSIIKALRDYAPDVYCKFEAGADKFGTDEEYEYINSKFPESPNISIDFAVMEKAPNVFVSCVNFGWNDLGTWGVLYEYSPKSKEGNVTQNCNAMLYNCHNNMIAVKRQGKLIVASGLKNFIIADSDDVLLICPQSEEQRIKQFVNDVKSSFGDKYQ